MNTIVSAVLLIDLNKTGTTLVHIVTNESAACQTTWTWFKLQYRSCVKIIFFTLVLYHTQKNDCNLHVFILYNKNSNGLLKDFGAWKKKNKSIDVISHGFDAICVCPLIDYCQ